MTKWVYIFSLCFAVCTPFLAHAEITGYIGEPLGIDFYSRIDENMGNVREGLRQTRLREYSTFRGFGRTCRPEIAWLDGERMDERVLIELSYGEYERLVALARKNNTPIGNTDSLARLAACLSTTYSLLYEQAGEQEEALSTVGNIGLYTDGDTKNSDYDIIADIEKINGILFTEKIDYLGTKNIGKISLTNLLQGKPVGSLFTNSPSPNQNTPGNSLTGGQAQTGTTHSGTGVGGTSPSYESLGIGAICRTGTPGNSGIAVTNIVDDAFLRELQGTLGGYTNPSNPGATYGPPSLPGSNNTNGTEANTGHKTSDNDFFQKPRCDGIFCIKVAATPSTQNLLAGGKTFSIESLLDKHIKISEPISLSDLSQQKMTNNSFQLPFLNIKFRDKVSGGRIYMSSSPNPKEQYKKEDTEAEKEKKFEEVRRCAFMSVGLPADKMLANGALGAGYSIRKGTNSTNIEQTEKLLGPIDPDLLTSCFGTAIESGRMTYYKSFSTDLSEIENFTAAVINEINTLLTGNTKLDTLPVK